MIAGDQPARIVEIVLLRFEIRVAASSLPRDFAGAGALAFSDSSRSSSTDARTYRAVVFGSRCLAHAASANIDTPGFARLVIACFRNLWNRPA